MGKIRFEPSFNVGSIVQMLFLLGSFLALYNKMDRTLAVHDERLNQYERRMTVLEKVFLERYGNTQRN
jgi:hypothetical protein